MKRILISNTALPSQKIGSWTNRISHLLANHPTFFDFVFSPNSISNSQFIFCKKRKWLPFLPNRFRTWEILNHRCGQYIQAFKKLTLGKCQVQVTILDDMILLEAFSLLKLKGYEFELVFSFHGHSFSFPGFWAGQVDKVLFLTTIGYLQTLQNHQEFTPLISIVGNGVDSSKFFPLSNLQKLQRKSELGVKPTSKVMIWLSNPRPKKGLQLFQKLAKRLTDKYPDLLIWIIGSKPDQQLIDPKIQFFGKIPNEELPKYLQAGDFYAFTSLWKEGFGLSLAEAAKCGNKIIASNIGGIPEVIENLPGSLLVNHPNSVDSWEKSFDQAWNELDEYNPDPELLNNFHDLETWSRGYLNALRS